MNKAVYYKFMFFFVGTWSICAALVFGILSPLVPSFLPFFGLNQDSAIYFWLYCFLMLILVSGFRFILVGLDIRKNHLVVSSSIISQLALFIIILVFFILGHVNWILILVGAVNLIFAALFIEFFVNYKKLDDNSIASAYSYKTNM